MNSDELLRRIRFGEDTELEFKQVFLAGTRIKEPKRNAIADEISALANARGGTLVLGIDDKTRNVVGIPLDALDAVEAWICEICHDAIKPPVDVAVLRLELPNVDGQLAPVICVEVERGLVVHKSPGGYYRRVGSSKREMTAEMLSRLFHDRSLAQVAAFDDTLVPGTSVDALDEVLTKRFLRSDVTGEGDEEDVQSGGLDAVVLSKLRIIGEDDGGDVRLTVAGTLLCTREPESWLPHAEIQCVRYYGERDDVNYQADARDVKGPIDRQVFEALHFVRRNMRVEARKDLAREEVPQYSVRAVFEALVNAVAHRDYSIRGSRIRLHMFRDRIEIYVPGRLVNKLEPESMAFLQHNRNDVIVSLLARCTVDPVEELGRSRMMDRRGDGVPIILRQSRRLAGRLPEYKVIADRELQLVIWAATAFSLETA